MKGDAKVIEHLNKALYNELIAINQYFLHAKMFKNWGLKELAEHEYKESIDEMKHADALIERILFLDGLPNLQNLGKLLHRRDRRRKCWSATSSSNTPPCPTSRPAIAHCEAVATTSVARAVRDILESEEEHIDWIETQLRPDRAHRRAELPADQARQLTRPRPAQKKPGQRRGCSSPVPR